MGPSGRWWPCMWPPGTGGAKRPLALRSRRDALLAMRHAELREPDRELPAVLQADPTRRARNARLQSAPGIAPPPPSHVDDMSYSLNQRTTEMLLLLIAPLPDDAQGGRLNGHIAVGLKVATHVLDVEVHTWRVLHARRRRPRWQARAQARPPAPPSAPASYPARQPFRSRVVLTSSTNPWNAPPLTRPAPSPRPAPPQPTERSSPKRRRTPGRAGPGTAGRPAGRSHPPRPPRLALTATDGYERSVMTLRLAIKHRHRPPRLPAAPPRHRPHPRTTTSPRPTLRQPFRSPVVLT